jgi:hypothetical protein
MRLRRDVLGFAPLRSLTAGVVGDLTETHVSARSGAPIESGEVSAAQPRSYVAQVAGSLRVDGQAGADADEGADQLCVAADDAELAAELVLRIGHVTPSPSPLPVREAAV